MQEHRQIEYAAKSSGRPRRSPIPDLRFEHSYLRSIQSYISTPPLDLSTRLKSRNVFSAGGGFGHGENTGLKFGKMTCADIGDWGKNESLYGVPLDIRWNKVAWVTMRDQILSPLIQGAVWGLFGAFVVPLTAQAGQSVRSFLGLGSTTRGGRTEYVGWWRRWIRSFYSGVETNVALLR